MKYLNCDIQLWTAKNYFKQSACRSRIVPYILAGLIFVSFYSEVNAANTAFLKGEVITYDIRKFKIKIGEATLSYNGFVQINNQKALSITFTARGFKFIDEEQIYLDPETFYPLVIKRNLNIFGREEKIIEFYDTQRGKVRIVKTVKGKTSEQTIENGRRFDNIYGFIYRQRQLGQFIKNKELHLHLPTGDVRFKFDKKVKFNVSSQEFDAYYMYSTPKKYKIWFDSSQNKIPLRIIGAIGYGNVAMEFTDRQIKG